MAGPCRAAAEQYITQADRFDDTGMHDSQHRALARAAVFALLSICDAIEDQTAAIRENAAARPDGGPR